MNKDGNGALNDQDVHVDGTFKRFVTLAAHVYRAMLRLFLAEPHILYVICFLQFLLQLKSIVTEMLEKFYFASEFS